MQSTPPDSNLLINLLQQQEHLYRNAMQLLRKIREPAQDLIDNTSKLTQRLHGVMQQVANIDQQIKEVRPELEKNGSLKAAEVQHAVAAQEHILRTLIGDIDASLGHVGQQQIELAESLDENANRTTMQAAYKVSMRTG